MKQVQFNRIKQQKIIKKIKQETEKSRGDINNELGSHKYVQFLKDNLNKYDQNTKKTYQIINFIIENNLVKQNAHYKQIISFHHKQQYLFQYNNCYDCKSTIKLLISKPKYLKPRIFMEPQSNLVNLYFKIRHQLFIKQQRKNQIKSTIQKSPTFTNHTTERNTVYMRNEERIYQKTLKGSNFLSNNQSQQNGRNMINFENSEYFIDRSTKQKRIVKMKTEKQSEYSLKKKNEGEILFKKKKSKNTKLHKLQNPYNFIDKEGKEKVVKKCQSTVKLNKQKQGRKLLTQPSNQSLSSVVSKHKYTNSEHAESKKRIKTQRN